MFRKLLFLLLFLSLCSASAFAYTTISGDMSGQTLIAGTYFVSDEIYVNAGATLTIEPGAILKFAADKSLTVNGTLHAVGLSTLYIRFTSQNDDFVGESIAGSNHYPDDGDWDKIKFDGTAPNEGLCEMERCKVNWSDVALYFTHCDTGYIKNSVITYSYHEGIYLSNSSPEIANNIISNNHYNCIRMGSNCEPLIVSNQISNSTEYGIGIESSSSEPQIINNTIHDCDLNPVWCYADQVGNIYGNTYADNGDQRIKVEGETISESCTWVDDGIPYYLPYYSNIYVQGTDGVDNVTTLTIAPGVEIQSHTSFLWIGHDTNSNYPGKLIANGTEENKITFTSSSSTPSAGDWIGIYFADYADDSSEISNCIIEYAGWNFPPDNIYPCISLISCSPTISDCIISQSGYSGIYASESSSLIYNCEIDNCVQTGIDAENSTLNILYCLIHDNDTGILNHVSDGDLLIKNCTLYGNNYGFSGSIGTSATILNSIIWNNTTTQISIDTGYSLNIGYCDIQNAWSGTGNINSDPEFVEPLLDNYELLYNSPCIDTGAPSSPLDPDGTRADMGAFYFDQAGGGPVITTISDIPDDQGHQVQIVWDKSPYDYPHSAIPIEQYSIWRYDNVYRDDQKLNSYDNLQELFANRNQDNNGTYYWDRGNRILTFIDCIPAVCFDEYSIIVPTLYDSSYISINYSKFIILAQTDLSYMYFESNPDSGYSIDNIPPCRTTANIAKNGNKMNLSWEEVEYGMFQGNLYPELNGVWYKIYAGNEPNFVCDQTHFVDILTDLSYEFLINSYDTKKFFKIVVSDTP